MAIKLPNDIERLLVDLEADLGNLAGTSSLVDIWTAFAARAARIRSLGGSESVRREVSRRLDKMLGDLALPDGRHH